MNQGEAYVSFPKLLLVMEIQRIQLVVPNDELRQQFILRIKVVIEHAGKLHKGSASANRSPVGVPFYLRKRESESRYQ